MRVHDDGRGHKHRPTLSSNSSHCHLADRCSTLIFFYLMLFVQVSSCKYGLVTKKIASACIDYIIVCAAVPRPWTGCCHKITKVNFEGLFRLSRKIKPHENYPPYGSTHTYMYMYVQYTVTLASRTCTGFLDC